MSEDATQSDRPEGPQARLKRVRAERDRLKARNAQLEQELADLRATHERLVSSKSVRAASAVWSARRKASAAIGSRRG